MTEAYCIELSKYINYTIPVMQYTTGNKEIGIRYIIYLASDILELI